MPENARKMKVLQIGKFYPPHMGGIETHLQTLCGSIDEDVDLEVVVSSENSSAVTDVIDNVRVERVPTWFTLASAPLCPGLVSRIRASAADLVHIHLPNPTAVLAYLVSGHPGKLVVTYHSDTVRQAILGAAFEPLLHRLLKKSDAIIVTSPDYLATSPVLQKHRERCHVIPYGIPLDQFQKCDRAAVARIRAEHGDRILLGVGRLVYYKGFEYIIEAMRDVRGRLLLIGTGPLLEKLQSLARDRGVTDRVIFLKEIQNEHITPYYHACDLFVLPSVARSEAFGIVQIEAMAAGRPVVNTKLDSGVPFVSQHGLTGLTVPPSNPRELADAVNRLLDDPDLRKKLGAQAFRRAEEEFSMQTMTARVLALYNQVVGQSKGMSRELAHQS